jgi:6-phosphofructokinase 1
MSKIQTIGVLTSGGDAPGMNAAIRAVTRTAIFNGLKVTGIRQGYEGMINAYFEPLKANSVSDIIQRGGTILKTARSKEFRTVEGRQKAYNNLKTAGIDAVVVIGGDGTFTGARTFMEEYSDISFVGLPGTIDNDLYGTDYTIGYDTAMNTAVDAIDKIRDTAMAHDRMFVIEVMGRDAGFIALNTGIACGAEAILIPEVKTDNENLKAFLEKSYKRKKKSNLIIVAEGERQGGAFALAEKIREDFPDYDVRVTVLGHIQRGGSPSVFDRVLASRLGHAAVMALIDGVKGVMLGIQNDQIVHVPLNQAIKLNKDPNTKLLELAEILSA